MQTSISLLIAEPITPGVVTLDLSWATDVAALLGIVAIIGSALGLWIRREVRKSLDDIKKEFKPNGGSSFKDQVNRLEARHAELDAKFDTVLDILSNVYATKIAKIASDKAKTDSLDTVSNRIVNLKNDK